MDARSLESAMDTAAPLLPAGTSDTIASAVQLLHGGGVLAVPTDTVYGLVGLYDNERAVERLYAGKGRPDSKPLPLLLGTATELALVAEEVPEQTWPLIYRFWPGPLTIILPARRSLLSRVTAGRGTVGVRVPAHPAVLDLLEALRLPLASTSANRSGEPPCTSATDVVRVLGSMVDGVITPDAETSSGQSSTVVDLSMQPFLIRRRGTVTPAQVREAVACRVDIAEGA